MTKETRAYMVDFQAQRRGVYADKGSGIGGAKSAHIAMSAEIPAEFQGISARKAVHLRCVDCLGGAQRLVRGCPCGPKSPDACVLWPFRMAIGPAPGGSRAKVIRAYCVWCCNDQAPEVRQCPAVECPLWQFRMGRREKEATHDPRH